MAKRGWGTDFSPECKADACREIRKEIAYMAKQLEKTEIDGCLRNQRCAIHHRKAKADFREAISMCSEDPAGAMEYALAAAKQTGICWALSSGKGRKR